MSNIKKARFNKKSVVISGIAVLIIVCAGAYFWHKHQTAKSNIPYNESSNSSKNSNNNGAKQTSTSNGSNPDGSVSDQADTSDKTQASSSALVKPSGAFVSNHRPSLSGSGGVPSSEVSVCNTTPGATCTITFTNTGNNAVKTLASQKTDSNGAVYWSWDINTAGFSQGTWTIAATSSLNGQSLSAKDALNLEVLP